MESGQGRPGEREPTAREPGTESQPPVQPQRRFGGSRLRPRVEIGAPRPRPPVETEAPEPLPEQPMGDAYGSPFGTPREFAGGRVRVYGCSPGCLITSLVVSLLLTLFLNLLF